MWIPRSISSKAHNVPWRDRVRTLTYIDSFLVLAWKSDRILLIGAAALRLFRACLPFAQFWVPKLILDRIVFLIRFHGGTTRPLWTLVLLQLALTIVGDVASRASTACEALFGEHFGHYLNALLISHSTTLNIEHFENPTLYDKLERARNQTSARLSLLASLFNIVQECVTLLTLMAGFMVLSRWLFLLLAVSTLPAFIYDGYFSALRYSTIVLLGPLQRQLDYLRRLGTNLDPAKEVRLFDLGSFLTQKYHQVSQRIYGAMRRLTLNRALMSSAMSVISIMGYYGAYILALSRVIRGSISLGTFTFVSSSFSRASSSIERIGSGFNTLSENSMYLRDLVEFLEMQPSISSISGSRPFPNPVVRGIEFENVSFFYPGCSRMALRDVSFTLGPNESLAIVGENGSGKSTVVKLLTRLYEPTNGRIFLDGIDLREYSLQSLRANIGVLFQDFVKYDMLLRENIDIGKMGASDNDQLLLRSIEASGSHDLVASLPSGLDQMLGRRFEGGIDLSGGQWQRVALARAHMRDAALLILDEPSASLDARSEHKALELFGDLVKMKMAILISHRFATVRVASKIVMLANGSVAGCGNHSELLARNSRYAELYDLQAGAYR
jgi:ATP-binding cassette, subfamily B, bacterial